MNNTLLFPNTYRNHKYSLIHFNFFIQYAIVAGIHVECVDPTDQIFISNDHLVFSCVLNGRQIIFDYADHWSRNWVEYYPGLKYFKFQTTTESHPSAIPLGPPMVGVKKFGTKGSTLREYLDLRWTFNYQPGSAILCKQSPNGAATERRNIVHNLLVKSFNEVDVDANCNQLDFWKSHENCLVSVCVPGATNNMVDRGQIELFGLGVCTISPELKTRFPGDCTPVPGRDYIKCADDYGDLVNIIRDLTNSSDTCKQIGEQARSFYDAVFTPKSYWNWILSNT